MQACMQVSLPSLAYIYIRSQCTYRHACSMLVRIYPCVYRVGVINKMSRNADAGCTCQYQYDILESQVSLPSQACIRSQCTYRHACSMLVRLFVSQVGVMNSRSLRILMPVVLASTSMRYLNVAGIYISGFVTIAGIHTFAMHVQACMLHARSNICRQGGCH